MHEAWHQAARSRLLSVLIVFNGRVVDACFHFHNKTFQTVTCIAVSSERSLSPASSLDATTSVTLYAGPCHTYATPSRESPTSLNFSTRRDVLAQRITRAADMAAEEPSTRSYPAFPSWRASARRTRAAAGERSWKPWKL